jgi:aspartate-semialdehyde dehydrogenase
MANKIKVGILGATGMVGQKYIQLLQNHPFFELTSLFASPKSAGKSYLEALNSRWQMTTPIPENLQNLIVKDVFDLQNLNLDLVFSCLDLDKNSILELEDRYAKAGVVVVSNNSANRSTGDVPMIIPEINHSHLDLIAIQKKQRGYKKGFIVVKPNCSIQSYLLPIFALINSGFEVQKILVTTMQAISGAGYPGVSGLDLIDNLIPFIAGEEEKTEQEPLKILGTIENEKLVLKSNLQISASCNRVPVIDGHSASVSLLFGEKKPTAEQILEIWQNFAGLPQELNLPLAPIQPIIYKTEENRPQPRKDRDLDKAMSVVVGRLRKCSVLDYKFTGLSHNTVRGAAGGGLLIAEMLFKLGYLKTSANQESN